MRLVSFICTLFFFSSCAVAQIENEKTASQDYLKYSWRKVATQMSDSWYASLNAKAVAETVLFCQQDNGGWMKNKPYHLPLKKEDSIKIKEGRSGIGSTIDNNATTTEMIFLAKMYQASAEERYLKAFNKAIHFLLDAQYQNGGWPQFYPYRQGNSVSYASHITYNDNAIVNVLKLFREIIANEKPFVSLSIQTSIKEKIQKAYSKGIDCILKTQIKRNNQLTVWCAQHDEFSLEPANARAYELASFSGFESVGIVQFLLEIKDPSKEIINSITTAMKWLDEHKITGIKVENFPLADGKKNMVVKDDTNAVPLLARFYDLDTEKAFFCDRDGVKKSALAEIGSERRNGYSWYYDGFESLQKKYNSWLKKWNINL